MIFCFAPVRWFVVSVLCHSCFIVVPFIEALRFFFPLLLSFFESVSKSFSFGNSKKGSPIKVFHGSQPGRMVQHASEMDYLM